MKRSKVKFKIIVFITVDTWIDCVSEILRSGYPIHYLVGLSPKYLGREQVSGYYDISGYAKKWNIPFYLLNDYTLKNENESSKLKKLDFNLIWVAGWQRLIPKWLIDKAKFGAIGGHGSPDGINGGRGRSPQNWALMLNANKFDLSLFKITPGIDDGPVILSSSFDYNIYDDIKTSYKKCSLLMADMIKQTVDNPEILFESKNQNKTPFYYPQRKVSDGLVDWSLTSNEIYNHCRALTRPYPGLRTKADNDAIMVIWKCQPFDNNVAKNPSPGIIDFIFEDNSLLVSTGDGRILITDYEIRDSSHNIKVNDKLLSVPFEKTLKKILNNHYGKYPHNKVSSRITGLVED